MDRMNCTCAAVIMVHRASQSANGAVSELPATSNGVRTAATPSVTSYVTFSSRRLGFSHFSSWRLWEIDRERAQEHWPLRTGRGGYGYGESSGEGFLRLSDLAGRKLWRQIQRTSRRPFVDGNRRPCTSKGELNKFIGVRAGTSEGVKTRRGVVVTRAGCRIHKEESK